MLVSPGHKLHKSCATRRTRNPLANTLMGARSPCFAIRQDLAMCACVCVPVCRLQSIIIVLYCPFCLCTAHYLLSSCCLPFPRRRLTPFDCMSCVLFTVFLPCCVSCGFQESPRRDFTFFNSTLEPSLNSFGWCLAEHFPFAFSSLSLLVLCTGCNL